MITPGPARGVLGPKELAALASEPANGQTRGFSFLCTSNQGQSGSREQTDL